MKYLIPAFLLFITFIQSRQAYGNDEIFFDQVYPVHMALQGQYLYLKPSIDNDFIPATNSDANIPFNLQPSGPGEKNRFHHTSGVHLNGYYFVPNKCSLIQRAGMRFTYVPATHSKRIHLMQDRGFLTSKHHLNFYNADLFASFSVFDHGCLTLDAESGVHTAWIHYKMDANAPVISARLRERSFSWGTGPALGLSLNYAIDQKFYFNGTVRGSMLISHATARLKLQPATNPSLRNPKTLIKVFPFWEADIRLGAQFPYNPCLLDIGLGYKYLSYPNFINRIQFPDVASSTNPGNQLTNIDFHGPYVSLLITF